MFYLSHTPVPPLSDFIENLWSLRDAPLHARERILPSGTLELVINLHEDEFRIYHAVDSDRFRRFSGAIVSGAYRGLFVIDTLEHASVLGVHFRPGGAFPFLGAPPGALADAHIDLEMLWGRRRAVELRDRLCAAASPTQRFRILEGALLDRLSGSPKSHGAVPIAIDHLDQGDVSVSRVAALVHLSHRRLIEVFSAEVGLTPKSFARVRRFKRAMALARRIPSPDWGRLALACGYFDQSHLIRDFRAFSDLSPEEFLRHRGDRVKENHVALIGAGSNSSNTRLPSAATVPAAGGSDGKIAKTL
jgi:AraC-like DNA-binding protein